MKFKSVFFGFLFLPFLASAMSNEDAQLYKEVEAIINRGSNVRKAEGTRLRAERKKALAFAKECGCVSDEKWKHFLEMVKVAKEMNPLFKPHITGEQSHAVQDPELEEITKIAKQRLRERNLNANAVNIEFTEEIPFNAAAYQNLIETSDALIIKNSMYFKPSRLSSIKTWLDKIIGHEISHLQKNHLTTLWLLSRHINYGKQRNCFTLFHHAAEHEANLLYSLESITHTQILQKYHCWPESEIDDDYYMASETHPSPHDFCQAATRVAKMLEFEKRIVQKKERQIATFDPANG